MRVFKKLLASTLAAVMLVGTMAVTAAQSPSIAPITPEYTKAEDVQTKSGNVQAEVDTTKSGKASVESVAETSKKNITLSSTVNVDGEVYTVYKVSNSFLENATNVKKVTLPDTVYYIGYKAFSNASETLKNVVITSKKAPTVNAKAFKGTDTSKLTITVTNMTKKQLKKFKKALVKAGFIGKVAVAK